MFRWYQNAERCYVYLSDVKQELLESDAVSPGKWNESFKKSRWFRRGWTLQELLAPRSVEFFSKQGAWLGDKKSLKHVIHQVTQIPKEALSGSDLSNYSAAERFNWIEGRQATREEDGAYCLLGIFGIYMSLIYGEGKDNAIKRLKKTIQESCEDFASGSDGRSKEERIEKIRSRLSAPHPSTNYHKAIRQRESRTGLWLLDSVKFEQWKQSSTSQLWLYGILGCGRTILSSTIIENLLMHCEADSSAAMAYFFFDFGDSQKQDPEAMVQSLLRQLLQRLATAPGSNLGALFRIVDDSEQGMPLHVLLELLRQAFQELPNVYIVLDALDVCRQLAVLLDIFATMTGWQLENLHLLITSRKKRDIEDAIGRFLDKEDTVSLQSDVVDRDIHRYVQQRLSNDQSLAKWRKNPTLKQEIESTLAREACGMYVLQVNPRFCLVQR